MGFQHISAERRREIAKMGAKALTTEQRRKAQASLSFEQLSTAGKKGGTVTGKRNAESGFLEQISNLPQAIKAHQEAGRRAVEVGWLESARKTGGKTTARKMSQLKPTWPECIFYGLILGDPITAAGFSAQQSDGHGIYDGAWREKKIIVELDGGGHHAFQDRHVQDMQKDIARMLDGNTLVRERRRNGDKDDWFVWSVAYLKALKVLAEESNG